MSFNLETTKKVSPADIDAAATLTSIGFGREEGEENYLDTKAHLDNAETIQFLRRGEDMVAFAAYRRALWQRSI